MMSLFAYLRKLDIIVLLPSAIAVDVRLRQLEVRRNTALDFFLEASGAASFIWVYTVISQQRSQTYPLPLFFPQIYWELYDSSAIPGAYDDALLYLLNSAMDAFRVDAAASRAAAEKMRADLGAGRVISLPRWPVATAPAQQ